MQRQLPELKMKQNKLNFLLGETLYRLHKTKAVRFLYNTQGEAEEKEVTKFIRLLDYLDERIKKIIEIYGDEDFEEETAEEEEREEALVVEAVPVAEKAVEIIEPPKEVVTPIPTVELPKVEELTVKEEPVKEAIAEVLPATEPAIVTPSEPKTVSIPEPISEIIAVAEPPAFGIPSESLASFENQPTAVAPEPLVMEPAITPEPEITPVKKNISAADLYEDILATATFSSDADKRLFEKNLKQLKKGNERDRQISLFQMAHLAKTEVLRKVYEVAMLDESSMVRLAVIKNISRMKDGKSAEFFELGLNDPDENVRTAAIKGIASYVSDQHGKILEGLLKDQNPHIRGLAVTYLGIYYGKDGLKQAMRSWIDESPYVRTSLIDMLAIVKPEGAFTIIKNLLSDRDETVKEAAEKALEKLMPKSKRR